MRHNRFSLLILWMAIVMTYAGSSSAGGVVCPVCGESSEEDACPNDGTNLQLLRKDEAVDNGKPPAKEVADGADSSTESNTGETEDDAKAPLVYKRHDEDGERKIVDTEEPGGYSDRQSRLPGDDRVVAAPKPKKAVTQADAAPRSVRDDGPVLTEFENRRQASWGARESIRLQHSKEKRDREAARRRLLESLGAPLTSLGGRIFWMGEGNRPGPVGTAEIDVNIIRYRVRAGLSTLLGVRALDERNELVFLESATVGMQWPSRFSPFAVAKGGAGVLATNRYGDDQAYLFAAFGAEVGLDAWLHPWLAITPSIGYMRCIVDRSYWNSFTFKLAVGF